MTMQIWICDSTKIALDWNTRGRNLSGVDKIYAMIYRCTCAACKNSACSVGSQHHAGSAEVDTNLNCTGSGTAPMSTLVVALSVPPSCEPAAITISHILTSIVTVSHSRTHIIVTQVNTIEIDRQSQYRWLKGIQTSLITVRGHTPTPQWHWHSQGHTDTVSVTVTELWLWVVTSTVTTTSSTTQ